MKLIGWVQISGSYTTLSDLVIDGSNKLASASRGCQRPGVSAGLSIEGTADVFQRNDYYQSVARLRGTGIGIGWSGSGNRTIIRHNRIHDVGQCKAFDHLIYLAHGDHVRIYGNWLWNDRHGWGIQVYPSVSGARIYANVVEAAGSGFTVGGRSSTSNNHLYHNVVLNSTGLPDAGTRGVAISDWWERDPGRNNTFAHNDSYHNLGGLANVSGVRLAHNTTVNPGIVDVRTHDFRVAIASRLARWGLWNGGIRAPRRR